MNQRCPRIIHDLEVGLRSEQLWLSVNIHSSKFSVSDSEVLICGEGIFVLTGSRLVHAAEKIIPGAKVSLEIELVSRFPTPIKCERISVSLQCKVR